MGFTLLVLDRLSIRWVIGPRALAELFLTMPFQVSRSQHASGNPLHEGAETRYVTAVNTPPMLVCAALLFWGWQTGLLPVAVVLACVLEGSRFSKVRWQFSQADLNRIWNLCT